MKPIWKKTWPVLRMYTCEDLARIAMPLGGIGTGTVSLGGRGNLRDWEVMNRPAKGFIPSMMPGDHLYMPFVCLRVQQAHKAPLVRVLEGPLPPETYEAANGSSEAGAGLPRFSDATFGAVYPLAQVCFDDPDVPLRVRLEAFNPLVPCDAEASGQPFAMLRYVLRNPTRQAMTATVCANVPNYIGTDGSQCTLDENARAIPHGAKNNRNQVRTGRRCRGIFMESEGVSPHAAAWGTMALCTLQARGVSMRTGWANRSWGGALLEFWDAFTQIGHLQQPDVVKTTDSPMASLACTVKIPAGEERAVTFLLAWHFPNRVSWTPNGDPHAAIPKAADVVGNYYTTKYEDAWEAAEVAARNLSGWEQDTCAFVRAFCESDLPAVMREAALFNLSTLRSQTCFRTPDGKFWGWEGTMDRVGSCHGNCTHVWNYEQATPFLFGDLAKDMRETEFLHATRKNGHMSFRTNLPLKTASQMGIAAADGQMGCLLKLYREWQLSGDDDFLRRLWPQAKKALAFAWVPGGWDADQDGVMEGCQHNTLDVEYWGPNPLMQGWYLGALRAAEAMALYLDDTAFADTCRTLFARGSAWTDEHLFNGEYYEHEFRLPPKGETIAAGLKLHGATEVPSNPQAQLRRGCLIDQVVGQYMTRLCGLGGILRAAHVKAALRSLMKYNFKPSMQNHVCHTRTYALGKEAAMVMAAHPRGREADAILHFNEVMTGFEYATAVQMIQEGRRKDGLRMIKAIRARYDGRKRNPFDEAECGHHYARAMASWAGVVAWCGFQYSAVTATLSFGAHDGRWFWSTGHAWGTCVLKKNATHWDVTLTVSGGALILCELMLASVGSLRLPRRKTYMRGTYVFRVA